MNLKVLLFILLSGCSIHMLAQEGISLVYSSKTLEIRRLSPHALVHTSFLATTDFGLVPCNGVVFINDDEAIVLDTPTTDSVASELISWLREEQGVTIKAVIPTHFHIDCLGGLKAFHNHHIPSLGYRRTLELGEERGVSGLPREVFEEEAVLALGDKRVIVRFFGEGHTRDNVVGYLPGEEILFGGCLIKRAGAGKGNLADANVKAWPDTVRGIRDAYPDIRIVVPGHGRAGGQELLDFTIHLFE